MGRPGAFRVSDGVMLDIKVFDDTDHRRITDEGNGIVLKNAVFLAKHGKLKEVRAVIVPDLYDGEKSIRESERFWRLTGIYAKSVSS